MAKRKTRSRRKRAKRFLWIIIGIMAAITSCMAVVMLISAKKEVNITKPDELLVTYMSYIQEKKYEEMYQMIDAETSGQISEEDFTKRNSAIYEGIEIQNMTTTVISYDEEKNVVQYQTAFDTVAGNITFENEAFFLKREDGYKLMWTDSLIYPGLSSTDKIRVSTTQAKRGEILDRNERVLAGQGVASSVGIVPGKLENRDSAIEQIADLLEMEPEEIEKKLSAKWVKDASILSF